jgi:hypothetical protein
VGTQKTIPQEIENRKFYQEIRLRVSPPSRSTGRGTPENMIIVARAIGVEGFGGQRALAMSDKVEGWGMPM